jgi:hypothetical protein
MKIEFYAPSNQYGGHTPCTIIQTLEAKNFTNRMVHEIEIEGVIRPCIGYFTHQHTSRSYFLKQKKNEKGL